jgi:thioredoxin reductase (NADPH)
MTGCIIFLMEKVFDCVVVGAGPGGLQAAIYLCRFNRSVLIIDRGGGRTRHARHIENFLTQASITGEEIIEAGLGQARHFGAFVEKATVSNVRKVADKNLFEVETADGRRFLSHFVLVSSGARDNLPKVENLHRFFGTSFFVCVDCDGYRTTGKKLVIIGNSEKTLRLALAMRQMYTKDITVVLPAMKVPPGYEDALREEGIRLLTGEPARLLGEDRLESIELKDGTRIPCEAVMSNLGYRLNDEFLKSLELKRDEKGFKYAVSRNHESSMSGLYIVGPLCGNDQVVIAAGGGALAAIDMNRRLVDIHSSQ